MLGISVDSVFSHRAFADSLGGFSYPLLADSHPHGEVTRRYGLWRPDRSLGRRAVFIVDTEGIIRWATVYTRGLPEIEELLTACEQLQSG